MTSLLVGSKSFSFKHKNFQKNTFSYSAQYSWFKQYIVFTVLVTVSTPLPTRQNNILLLTAPWAAACALPPPRSGLRKPFCTWPPLVPLPRHLPTQRSCAASDHWAFTAPRAAAQALAYAAVQAAVIASYRFFNSFSVFNFPKHHHSTSKRIPRLQEAPHHLSLVWFTFSSLRNTSQN